MSRRVASARAAKTVSASNEVCIDTTIRLYDGVSSAQADEPAAVDNQRAAAAPMRRARHEVPPLATQRFESSVTAVSWIPSEAISGPSKIPFELGVTHYDQPPPDRLESIEELRTSDRFREANELRAFIEVEDGRIVRSGHLGQGHIGATTVRRRAGGDALPRGPAAGHPGRARGRRVVRALRPDDRRPHGAPDAPAGAPSAVRPVLAVDRVDDARPDDQRRRQLEPRARRREPVPAPLDLRRRRGAWSRSPAPSTSGSGSTTRMAIGRRGARRTRRR